MFRLRTNSSPSKTSKKPEERYNPEERYALNGPPGYYETLMAPPKPHKVETGEVVVRAITDFKNESDAFVIHEGHFYHKIEEGYYGRHQYVGRSSTLRFVCEFTHASQG